MSVTAQQPATVLVPGRDFPRNYAELRRWFPTTARAWTTWIAAMAGGLRVPRCGGGGSRLEDGRHGCEPCYRRVSSPRGRSSTDAHALTVWFAVAWSMTSSKNGVAALTLIASSASVPIKRYGPSCTGCAWRWCGGPGSAGRRRGGGRDALRRGSPGKPGRGAAGKVLVAVAIERHEPKGFGRCRLRVIPNAKTVSLDPFLRTPSSQARRW